VNLGVRYLPGAIGFDPAGGVSVGAELASRIVAFDAFVMNVDRTVRNPNLLWWRGDLWLIDHGAALYWHHDWNGGMDGADRPFKLVRDHVLLPAAGALPEAGAALIHRLTDDVIRAAVARVPEGWLTAPVGRAAYVDYLSARRDRAAVFIQEAIRARG
jgi:hypothetical protein